MGKRDQTPPYEIMRSAPSGAAPGDAAQQLTEPDPTPRPAKRAPWWVGSSAPLVLRVPRGLALVVVGGVLLVIVVAYFVGKARGGSSGQPQPQQALIGDRPGPAGWFESDKADYTGPEVLPPEQTIFEERREPGLWYVRLMTSTPEDCRRLAEFMTSRGVAIQLVMRDNGKSCIAYAIDRAYRTDEYREPAAQHYLSYMKERGREWKIHNKGQGNDLSTMYFAQYSG